MPLRASFWLGDGKKSGFVCSVVLKFLCLGLEGLYVQNTLVLFEKYTAKEAKED